jgi:hypothetical protein
VTSIADSTRPSRAAATLRGVLLLAVLVGGALVTPPPWAELWVAVPTAVAVSLLLAWRFGARALVLPPVLYGALALVVGPFAPWAWWVPAAALSGAWMGLREEHPESAGGRAWMLLPVLALAALLPWLPGYGTRVGNLERELRSGDSQMLEMAREMGMKNDRLESLRRTVEENAPMRRLVLPNLVPSVLFVWVVLLVAAGRALGSRVAEWLRWPALSRMRLAEWRLPDGAIWTFLAGLGLLVAQWPAWAATAWTLLLNTGLGFCLQGIAVVESLMLARGVPPSVIALTLMFVCVLAMPVFVFATAVLGLSDFWLDFRRIETPDGDAE